MILSLFCWSFVVEVSDCEILVVVDVVDDVNDATGSKWDFSIGKLNALWILLSSKTIISPSTWNCSTPLTHKPEIWLTGIITDRWHLKT